MPPFLKLKTMLSFTTATSTFVRFTPKAKALGHKFNYPFSSSSSSIQFQYPPLDHQWSGLDNWRHGPLNRDRFWGPNGPFQGLNQTDTDTGMGTDPPLVLLSSCSSVAEMGAVVLSTADPLTKSKLSHFAYDKWRREGLPIGVSQAPPRPARPLNPQLVIFLFFYEFQHCIYLSTLVFCIGYYWIFFRFFGSHYDDMYHIFSVLKI